MERGEEGGEGGRLGEERQVGGDQLRVVEGDARGGGPLAADHLAVDLGAGAAVGGGATATRRGEVKLEERVLEGSDRREGHGEIAGVEAEEESSEKERAKGYCLVKAAGTDWMRRRRKRSSEEKA